MRCSSTSFRAVFLLLASSLLFLCLSFSRRSKDKASLRDNAKESSISHDRKIQPTSDVSQSIRSLRNGYVVIGGDLKGEASQTFGRSVAADRTGSTVAFGTRISSDGVVRVYEENVNRTWTQKGQDLVALGANDGFAGDGFGATNLILSDDGNIVAISANFGDYILVFQYNSATLLWEKRGTGAATIAPSSVGSLFQHSLSMSGDGERIVLGIPFADANINVDEFTNEGGACRYIWDGADYGSEGSFVGNVPSGAVGASISISGDGQYVAVGMPSYGQTTLEASGQVRIYFGSPILAWGFDTNLRGVLSGVGFGDGFGTSVAFDRNGATLAVASRGISGNGGGRVQVFKQEFSNVWRQIGSALDGDETDDGFGASLDLSDDGMTLVAGTSGGNDGAGYARIYRYDTGSADWIQQEISRDDGFDIDGSVGNFDEQSQLASGLAVSGDGSRIIVGAPGESGFDGLVRVWTQTQYPTFSPIRNSLTQVRPLAQVTPASPAPAPAAQGSSFIWDVASSSWQWLKDGASSLLGLFD